MTGALPLPADPAVVRSFFEAFHGMAAAALNGARNPGMVQLVRIHPANEKPQAEQFEIGDIDGMSQRAVLHAEAGFNVYAEPRTVARVARGQRGKLSDTRGVFAFVIDADADKGRGGGSTAEPTLAVETVAAWNERFALDWFAFRAALADLSARSARAVPGAETLSIDEPGEILSRARATDGLAYFHDDDDLFSPSLPDLLAALGPEPDAIVTASFEIAPMPETIIRDGQVPPVVVGRLSEQVGHARYQTNNTGLRFRHLRTADDVEALGDHVTASAHATQRGFRDLVLPTAISATIKSPASATMLPRFLRPIEPAHFSAGQAAAAFEGIGAGLPPGWDWLRHPLADVARLCHDLASSQRPERTAA